MSDKHPKHPWKIDANDRYQKVITTITGFATASLILPTIFLRDFLGVEKGIPLLYYFRLNPLIYWCWFAWALSIVGSIVYGYVSAKWVKQAWGKELKWRKKSENRISSKTMDNILNWTFWLTAALYMAGIVLFLMFAANAKTNVFIVKKDMKIDVAITRDGKIFKETLLCQLGPDGKTPTRCKKQSDSSVVSKEDIIAMNLQGFFPEAINKNQTRHSYTNCSGPEMFHCVDVEEWVEECKNEYVCMPGGLVPDSCSYVNYCYNHWVKTHECTVVGTCIRGMKK